MRPAALDRFMDEVFTLAAHEAGAACELYALETSHTLLKLPAGDEYASSLTGLCLRCAVDGREGLAYTEDLSERAARQLVETALAGAAAWEAAAAVPSPGAGARLSPEVLPPPDAALGDVALVRAKRAEVLQALRRHPSLAKTTGNVRAVRQRLRLANSAGLDLVQETGYAFCELNAVADNGREMRNALVYRGGSRLADIDAAALCGDALAKTASSFGARPVSTGSYDLVLAPDTASYLLQGMAPLFSGPLALEGGNRFKDRLGTPVAAPCVSIVDDPGDVQGSFMRSFDAQGHPAVRRTIVRDGTLLELLHDDHSARAMGGRPGSAWRLRFNSPSLVDPTNMRLSPGTQSLAGLLARLGDGLYVTGMAAYFQNVGIVARSGRYALPINGCVVEGGRPAQPFDGVIMMGDLYDLLLGIEALGDDCVYGMPTSYRTGAPAGHGCFAAPSLLVRGVSISGA